MDIKIEDFKKSIREKNIQNRRAIIDYISKDEKLSDIIIHKHKGLPGKSKYMYDFIWIDGEYKESNFRICLYFQDIDEYSLNVHIQHGTYTFQKNLVKNGSDILSIFDGNLNCKDSFLYAMKNISHSSYDADSFEIEPFVDELLRFLNHPTKK